VPTVLKPAFTFGGGVAVISQLGSGWALWAGDAIIQKALNPDHLVRAARKLGAIRVDIV
jgi:hypothetical protein